MQRCGSWITVSILIVGLCSSCVTPGKRTRNGAGVGAATGAAAGAIVNRNDRGKGAIVGAIVGGLIGGAIGNKLDQQAKELAEIAETKRTRDGIVTKLRGDLLFPIGKSHLSADARATVNQLADIIIKYPEDHLTITGHTDSTGPAVVNQKLSRKRAHSVKEILVARGVPADRVKVVGAGPSDPVAPNDTASGRAKNRRVEIQIQMPEQSS